MNIDLTHNKIVKETVTEGFVRGINTALLPLLVEKHGAKLTGIQMYEDYISDAFVAEGVQYYPLTLMTDSGTETEWICWSVDKTDYKEGVPFAYVGEGVPDFSIVPDGALPAGFEDKLSGRARFCEEGNIRIRVEAAALAPTFLSGKYSQTFVDEMARQLTPAISSALSVRGLAESNIELSLVFAPETYMEHTSENVTYRRLIMNDKTSVPRDFWIKWTRLDGATAFTVSDNVSAETVCFELGEDVPQKIREKEYRFLLRTGKDKYHNSMGRKNITEWREIVKRAIRRGELEKIENTVQLSEQAFDVSAEFARALGIKAAEPTAAQPVNSDLDDEAIRLARELLAPSVTDLGDITDSVDTDSADTDSVGEVDCSANDAEDEDELFAEADDDGVDEETLAYYEEENEISDNVGVIAADDEEARALDEVTRLAAEALRASAASHTELTFDEPVDSDNEPEALDTPESDESVIDGDADEELDPLAELYDEDDAQSVEELSLLEPEEEELLDDGQGEVEFVTDAPMQYTEDMEARIRAEVEAKVRLEYEREARLRAEEEMRRLKLEQDRLRAENERLIAEAERRRAEEESREQERLAEESRMRAELEARLRQEEREKERLAEAAKLAVEEQRRIEEERARIERERIEQEHRLELERMRVEEERRREAEIIAERERILREASTAAAEDPVDAAEAAPAVSVDDGYHYTSKTVKLIFRKHVDPNVTARMHEIIKATVEYYGKEKVALRIRATIPDNTTVCLEFLRIPEEEMELLSNIIKVLGNSGLGIAKAVVD